MVRGQSLIIPPLFDGTNYAYWKACMRAFLQSLDEKVQQAMEISWTKPTKVLADQDDAKIKPTKVNSAFNLGETISKPKIVRKVLRSLPERFHTKITAIEESKDIGKIPLIELVGNLQTYELDLTRIGKSSKGKSMALKAKSSDTDESSDDEDSKMKSYIMRQFKKFMKNANAKGFNKDRKQSNSSQFKNQDKGKKDVRNGSQYTTPSRPKCLDVKVSDT